MIFMTAALSVVRTTLDFLLPPHCAGCDEMVGGDGEFCPACFARARFLLDPSCRGCAVPFETQAGAGPSCLCPSCEDNPPAWDEARAAFVYDDFSRRLVLPLKYADRTENARVLGAHMARAGAVLLDKADFLVPVPLHRSRLRTRRYNQALLLARAAVRGRPRETTVTILPDALHRRRKTAPLASRGVQARAAELEGAIEVRPSVIPRLRGARVVLVDDVLTTGATASACAVSLRQAGVASVTLLVAARTIARVRIA